MMQLDVYDGDVRVDTLTLTKDTTVLGRALDVDIRIEHASTSRKHCEIVTDTSGAYYVIDLKSSQGTHLNGNKIPPNEPQKLADGYQLKLGASARIYKVVLSDGGLGASSAAAAAQAAERERYERERAEAADRERYEYERQRAEQERLERERYEFERAERDRRERQEAADRERYNRERAEQERADRERYEYERAQRERAERERIDRLIRDQPAPMDPSPNSMRTKNSYGGGMAPPSQPPYQPPPPVPAGPYNTGGYSNGYSSSSVPKLNMAAKGEVVHEEGPNAPKVFASPRSTTPFKKGAVHAVREQIEQKLESERTARDSQRDSLRDSLRGTSPIRGASPIRGSMQSSAPPPPASYVPSSANYGNELPRSGSFSANGQRGYSPKRSVSNGNGMANGSSPLTYKQQDTVAAIIHMLDDSNMTGTEKAQVLAAVSSRIGMR